MELKIVIIVVVVLLLILFLIYNYLVKLSNRCNNAWSNIDNQLKRRIDLAKAVFKGIIAFINLAHNHG